MDLTRIATLAAEQMAARRSHDWKEWGNKYSHGQRVANLAVTLRQGLLPGAAEMDPILTVAAWFHDIANGQEDHGRLGAQQTRQVLSGLMPEVQLDAVCGIIGVHDDRHSPRARFSDMVKLHQDADHLDHFGTYDVWLNIRYAVAYDRDFLEAGEDLAIRAHEKGRDWCAELNFELSRQIMQEKLDFARAFGERMRVEGNGGIFAGDRATW